MRYKRWALCCKKFAAICQCFNFHSKSTCNFDSVSVSVFCSTKLKLFLYLKLNSLELAKKEGMVITILTIHWTRSKTFRDSSRSRLLQKALNTGNPPYLASLLHQHNPCRSLRSASANLLSVTQCNLSFGTRGFRTAAPTVWNSLPPNVRSCKSLATFRKHLKSHLFQSSFPTA